MTVDGSVGLIRRRSGMVNRRGTSVRGVRGVVVGLGLGLDLGLDLGLTDQAGFLGAAGGGGVGGGLGALGFAVGDALDGLGVDDGLSNTMEPMSRSKVSNLNLTETEHDEEKSKVEGRRSTHINPLG